MLFFARAEFRRPWGGEVVMTDAAPNGFGVVEGSFPSSEVEQIGAFDERWRFKPEYRKEGGEAPREAALRALDPCFGPAFL